MSKISEFDAVAARLEAMERPLCFAEDVAGFTGNNF